MCLNEMGDTQSRPTGPQLFTFSLYANLQLVQLTNGRRTTQNTAEKGAIECGFVRSSMVQYGYSTAIRMNFLRSL